MSYKSDIDNEIARKYESCPGCGRRDREPCPVCEECKRCCKCWLLIKCDYCGAEPKKVCRSTVTGRPYKIPHDTRLGARRKA